MKGDTAESLRSNNPGYFDKSAVQRAMVFAKKLNKKVIYISLKAPYDVINYHGLADAILATYSIYGSDNNNPRGLSLNAATEVIIGKLTPRGKLPVDIFQVDNRGRAAKPKYPNGFGLTTHPLTPCGHHRDIRQPQGHRPPRNADKVGDNITRV